MDGLRHFDALGFRFAVKATEPKLAAYLDYVLDGLARPGPAAHHYELGSRERDGGRTAELRLDGEFIIGGHSAERLVGRLIQDVNRRAVEGCGLVTLHAGAVEHDGLGVVLPAPPAAGKSTLVAALVRSGFRYLTDEAVALDGETLAVRPYPKPLTLDPGSWPLFPELEPHADLSTDAYKAAQWHVPPGAFRAGSVGQSCPIRVLVFPRYEAGAEPTLERARRGEALVELARNTFRFREHGPEALELLAEVVRPAVCYRLTTGVLEPAVALIGQLAGR
jgi:hypothetical protein